MYEIDTAPRQSPRKLDLPAGIDPALAARQALARVRRLLAAFSTGMVADPAKLLRTLDQPFAEPALERERLFALGWLHWRAGDFNVAAGPLADAERRCLVVPAGEVSPAYPELPALEPLALLARSAYWHARVRLLAAQSNAVADYEAVMRKLGGSPQATAWYVDLLWRSGKVDRADQVWKSVRTNKRVAAADEGPLLDARAHLRRGELGPAEKLLREMTPTSGVVLAERHLLWAWIATTMRQFDRASEQMQLARQGVYPERVLDAWQAALAARRDGRSLASLPLPEEWREFLHGQAARSEGKPDIAEANYRQALATPAVTPFARYGLVALGCEEASVVLPTVQGLFFAVRLRARQAIDRFRRRESSPADLLEALKQAQSAHHTPAGAEHYTQLATLLQQRRPGDLGEAIDAPGIEGRNLRRVALELTRRLSPAEALPVLLDLARSVDSEPEGLRAALGHRLFSQSVRHRDRAGLAEAAVLLPGEPLLALATELLGGPEASGDSAAIWRLANALAAGGLDDVQRQQLATLHADARFRPLAVALSVHDAARRNDLDAIAALLGHGDAWRGFREPPAFVVRAIEAVASTQPGHTMWPRCLPGWLGLWPAAVIEKTAAALLPLTGESGQQTAAPAGVDATAWFSHQAARALQRDDPTSALALIERAGGADVVPALKRLAAAQALAGCVGGRAEALPGLVDRLGAIPEGESILRAAQVGDRAAVMAGLSGLALESDLDGVLVHHLALVFLRQAEADPDHHSAAWGLAWPAWLSFLASAAAPADGPRTLLLDHLIGAGRRRINDLLSRSLFEPARLCWEAVQALPGLAKDRSPSLADDLAARVARFRNDLATEYLVTTREAMRFGANAEGLRADYDRGLGLLRRLLSLDGDNVRLLTALIETCNEWFLDLYHLQDRGTLRQQLDRFMPFASKLARLVSNQPSQVAARSALSDYWKARGFLESDQSSKMALYREALAFNPANENVRELLAEMEAPEDTEEASDE